MTTSASAIYSLALGSGAAALASLLSVTLPLELPSPKKMTSTVRSSLWELVRSKVRKDRQRQRLTCIVLRRDSAG